MVNHGRWEPQGDDALIELRAREVGTTRNPLIGQPSTSGSYGEQARNVAHPGPLGFVVLAPGTRLLGPVTGTLLSTAAVSAGALLTVAFLLFRIGGARAGAAGALLGALAALSAGAAGLVDPLSSNFGRFALLAAAVGVWALLCGDVRALPLTVGWWTFAAQQHLSVGPAAAVLAAAGAVGLGLAVWRPGELGRRRVLTWIGVSAAVGLVLWGPVLYQQVTGDPGNLTALRSYSRDDARVDLGLRSAVTQVSRVLGPVPFLGRSQPTGWQLVSTRSTLVVLAVLAVVAAMLAVGAWWARRDRRFLAAVAMVGVLVVAGLLTGANIPDSPEQGRLNFFHWAFALSFFELLALGWLGAKLAPVVLPKLTHGRASTAAVIGGVVVLGVAFTPLVVDRSSDRLGQPLPASVVHDLLGEVRSAPELAAVEGPVLVAVNGDDRYIQVGDTVGTRLAIEGRQILFPASSDGFVHPSRIADDPCTVDHVLVISLLRGERVEPPGTELARVDGAPGLDRAALDRLTTQAQAAPVEFGDDLEAALAALPGDQGGFVGSTLAFRLRGRTDDVLLVRSNLDLLIDHPIASPELSHDDLVALRGSLPDGAKSVVAEEVTAHLLDRAQYAAFTDAC
ncbi:MAG: hypothetical protein KDA94_13600 [Acidimicrobiales bacterium]|nr:hypothetical protein [Acidimicrobiales bacterium]